MAFPSISITETFTAANGANPPPTENGIGWTGRINSADGVVEVQSNRGQGQTVANNSCYTTSSLGPDTETWVTVVTRDTSASQNTVHLYTRLSSAGGTSPNGYSVGYTAGTTHLLQVFKLASGTHTQIGSNVSLGSTANGDAFGYTVSGTGATVTIEVWFKASGGSWVSQGTYTDSTSPYVAAGPTGFRLEGNVYVVDDYAGNTYTASGPVGYWLVP